jgi:purine-binding chemotaxis protein CheW
LFATRQFCSFFVDELCFGIDVDRVEEIRNLTAMTRVPLASRVVGGLVNLRGHIVTAIDVRRCLDLSERSAGERPVNIILRPADGGVSLLVDRIGDVVDVTGDALAVPAEMLNARSRALVRMAYKLDERLLLVLNIEQLVNGIADGSSAQPGGVRGGVGLAGNNCVRVCA